MSSIVRNSVLQAEVLEIGDAVYTGDTENDPIANNKLNFDRLHEHPQQLQIVSHHLSRVIFHYRPQALLGITKGGEMLAEVVNNNPEFPDMELIYVDKDEEHSSPGVKAFTLRSNKDKEILDFVDSLVVVEDVIRKLTSTRGVLAIKGVLEKTLAVVGVWDRGLHPSREPLPVPTETLVTEYIPRKLRETDEIYIDSARLTEK